MTWSRATAIAGFIELERTAADRGETRITVALMEEVKARYFGMGVRRRKG